MKKLVLTIFFVLMNAFLKFNKGIMKMPVYWQLWLMLLVAGNLVIPLFFLGRPEAQLVLGAFFLNMVLFTILTGTSGFTRLLGLGHLPWIGLVSFLWMRLDQIPVGDFFGLWIRILLVINTISLVIDAAEVIRYALGDRQETVKGL